MEDNNFNAWLAGFWEGEGSAIKCLRNTGYEITICQAIHEDRPVRLIMERIQKEFGGLILKINSEKYRTVIRWRLTKREDNIRFINTIYPYCQIRKKQLEDILLHYKNNPRRGYNDFKIAKELRQEGKTYKEITKILGRKDIWRLLNRTFYAKYANLYY